MTDVSQEMVARLRAICSEVDVFDPDMRAAARSIFEAQEKVWKLVPNIIAALEPSQLASVVGERDALLRELREPTEAMLDASWKLTGESKEMRLRTHAHYKRHWQAMIDEALSTPSETPKGEDA